MAGRRWNGPGPAQEGEAPMQKASKQRRASGTGSIVRRRTSAGRVVLWGKFRAGGNQRWVRLGLERQPGSKLGLTRSQAEAMLRRAIEAALIERPLEESL